MDANSKCPLCGGTLGHWVEKWKGHEFDTYFCTQCDYVSLLTKADSDILQEYKRYRKGKQEEQRRKREEAEAREHLIERLTKKLKPCPFCGASAYISYDEHYDEYSSMWAIRCSGWKCISTVEHLGDDIEKMVEEWNTRVEDKD